MKNSIQGLNWQFQFISETALYSTKIRWVNSEVSSNILQSSLILKLMCASLILNFTFLSDAVGALLSILLLLRRSSRLTSRWWSASGPPIATQQSSGVSHWWAPRYPPVLTLPKRTCQRSDSVPPAVKAIGMPASSRWVACI